MPLSPPHPDPPPHGGREKKKACCPLLLCGRRVDLSFLLFLLWAPVRTGSPFPVIASRPPLSRGQSLCGDAIQGNGTNACAALLDCFVAALLAMTESVLRPS